MLAEGRVSHSLTSLCTHLSGDGEDLIQRILEKRGREVGTIATFF